MKQSSVSVLFSLAVLLVVVYPSPAQDSAARTATTRETRQVKVITSCGFTAAFFPGKPARLIAAPGLATAHKAVAELKGVQPGPEPPAPTPGVEVERTTVTGLGGRCVCQGAPAAAECARSVQRSDGAPTDLP